MIEKQFRFQDFEIWKRAAELSKPLFDLSRELDKRRLFDHAHQLRSATLSITNNIAEGSGSVSKTEFANFLNISRRSVFEVANMLLILFKDHQLSPTHVAPILTELEEESRMLLAFRRTLKN